MPREDAVTESSPLPERPGEARLIVCERTGRWAVAIRQELAGTAIRVHETRSIAECWDMLPRYPASFLVVELTPSGLDPLLVRVAQLGHDFPAARIAVVAERGLAAYQWVMREAGAIHFVVSTRELTPLAQAIRRCLNQAPLPEPPPTERIWAELPWGRGEP